MQVVTKPLKLSAESRCVQNKDMAAVQARPTLHSFVVSDHLGLLGPAQIAVVETRKDSYYADQTTGSLYDMQTLRCLTSAQLHLRKKPAKSAITKYQSPKKETQQ